MNRKQQIRLDEMRKEVEEIIGRDSNNGMEKRTRGDDKMRSKMKTEKREKERWKNSNQSRERRYLEYIHMSECSCQNEQLARRSSRK